jgi:hypothetical protein
MASLAELHWIVVRPKSLKGAYFSIALDQFFQNSLHTVSGRTEAPPVQGVSPMRVAYWGVWSKVASE